MQKVSQKLKRVNDRADHPQIVLPTYVITDRLFLWAVSTVRCEKEILWICSKEIENALSNLMNFRKHFQFLQSKSIKTNIVLKFL